MLVSRKLGWILILSNGKVILFVNYHCLEEDTGDHSICSNPEKCLKLVADLQNEGFIFPLLFKKKKVKWNCEILVYYGFQLDRSLLEGFIHLHMFANIYFLLFFSGLKHLYLSIAVWPKWSHRISVHIILKKKYIILKKKYWLVK